MHLAKTITLVLFAISFFISLPTYSQQANELSRPPETPEATYPDTTDGLVGFLQNILATAKGSDTAKFAFLIKGTEIPNYDNWLPATFGPEKGRNLANAYGSNREIDNLHFRTFLLNSSQEKGNFSARKVNNAPEEGNSVEKEMLDTLTQPIDIFSATWNCSDGDEKSMANPIGYFMFVDGKFRWIDASRLVQVAGKDGGGYPQCQYCPTPVYSKAAKKAKFQGKVELQIIIEPDGRATNIQVVKAVGLGLDEAAIEAVRTWRFKPATDQNGRAVPVSVPTEINFRSTN